MSRDKKFVLLNKKSKLIDEAMACCKKIEALLISVDEKMLSIKEAKK